MDVLCLIYGIEIPNSDWEKTPASVKELVEKLGQLIKQSEKELADKESQNQDLLEKMVLRLFLWKTRFKTLENLAL